MNEKNKILKFFGWILVFASIVYILLNCYVYLVAFSSSHQLNLNQEKELLRIKIYGSSDTGEGSTVSGTFAIIDSNGNEIAVIERSWSGAYLAVDFVQVNLNGKNYIFPSRIFGKQRIIEVRKERKSGIFLEKYYNDYRQSMLLGYGSTLKDRRNLYNISLLANKNIPILNLGTTTIHTMDLSDCKTNTFYSISFTREGRFLIQEI